MKGKRWALIVIAAAVTGSLWFGTNGEATSGNNGVPDQIQQLRTEFSALQQTVQTQQDQISGLQQQVTSLQTENKSLNTKIEAQQSEITNLKSQVSTLTETLQAQVQNLQADLTTAKENFNTELQRIRTELESLKPDTNTYTVKGVMVDSTGEFFYQLMVLEGSNGTRILSGQRDNGYTFENVPNGTYQLKFASPYIQSFAPPHTVVVNHGNVENPAVKFSVPIYGVSGTTLKADGSPLSNVKVMMRDNTGQAWGGFIFTDNNGSFHFFGLPNGTYNLEFGTPTNIVLSKEITISNSNLSGLIIHSTPQNPSPPSQTYSVSGTMFDANGKTLYTGIELIDASGKHYPISTLDPTTYTFTFTNLPNGTYTLNVHYRNYEIESPHQIIVAGSDVANLQIKLAVPTYTVSGKVLATDGTPMVNKRIWLEAPGNRGSYWLPTSNDGSFSLTGIATGTYKMLVGTDPNNPLATYDFTVSDSDVFGIEVRSN